MAYLSIDEFREYSAGVNLDDITDEDELGIILEDASALCDAFTNTTWKYQTITNEVHSYRNSWEFIAYKAPIRKVLNLFLGMSINSSIGDYTKVSVPITTMGPPNLPPGELPTIYGQTSIDRATNRVVMTYTVLQIGLPGQFLTVSPFDPPQFFFSYTAGYDSGALTGININNGGSSYTSAPTVTIDPSPQGSNNANATATATITNGSVTGITLTQPGYGYNFIPNITISGGGGNGASATALGQSDGFLVPAPQWLRTATRLVAASIITERNLAAQGLSGVQQVRQGESEFRRSTESNNTGLTIPGEAKTILQLHRKTSILGSK